jgi:site-specific recombinase XerD
MRTTSAKAKPSQGLSSVIAATKKLCRQYDLTYDQTHYVAKEVRRTLALEQPKTRQRVIGRLSREEERTLIAHAYHVQGTQGLLIKMLFQTAARVSEFVNITADEVFFKEQMVLICNLLERGMPIEQIQKFLGHSKLETIQIYAESSAEMLKESYQRALGG